MILKFSSNLVNHLLADTGYFSDYAYQKLPIWAYLKNIRVRCFEPQSIIWFWCRLCCVQSSSAVNGLLTYLLTYQLIYFITDKSSVHTLFTDNVITYFWYGTHLHFSRWKLLLYDLNIHFFLARTAWHTT